MKALSPIGIQSIPNHLGFNGRKSSFFSIDVGKFAEPHKSLHVIFSSYVVDWLLDRDDSRFRIHAHNNRYKSHNNMPTLTMLKTIIGLA